MQSQLRAVAFAVCTLIALGCATGAQQAPPAAVPTEPTEPVIAGPELFGVWVEFWSVSGHTDTQRYAFFEDGRFGWRAAATSTGEVSWRWGQATLAADGKEMLLSIEGHASLNCADAACRVQHNPSLQERITVGPCPANEEARTLDADYRCFSLDGRAFWRHAHHMPAMNTFFPE